ncbi:succinate dehydrogenase assembly factor 2 [Devosia sp. XJ19-1]|uniref:FAD assembly factor SdhE n=1 Tax=Devosia ureilytica TaxID=2952754 RepID=A0A9Q4ALT3_9HYPH|nr:succinate dehydrogenase assembly factor 2 [Devosia ureilytica]MCP8882064.1 succinate dehydrogenase assembly factor 2 [Devosia ureilytica]MCP8886050.1 succinate dehydrogenase assembly factor 2 [Devosia ureilytica]
MGVEMAAGEDISIRRKRLRYRAWHRGTKEMDLILGPFADANIEAYDTAELDRLEALMDEEDPPLLKWVMRQEEPPTHVDRAFLDLVIADHQARIAK